MKKVAPSLLFVALLVLVPIPSFSQNILASGTIDSVVGNVMREINQSFTSDLINDIFEVTSGTAKGSRFLVTDVAVPETLICDTGLINDYTKTIQDTGASAGDTYSVLESQQLASASGQRAGDFSIKGTGVAWVTDEFKDDYVYLTGYAGGVLVDSFYEIATNTTTTLVVAGKLPAYDATITITIIANPGTIPPPNDFPTLLLGTDSILTAEGTLMSIGYQLIPGDKDPLNEVDPYIAMLDPAGRLFFLRKGKWSTKAQPMTRTFFIGSKTEGVLFTFIIDSSFAKGAYTVYGVLNTPDANVYNRSYWRSNLARASFFVQ